MAISDAAVFAAKARILQKSMITGGKIAFKTDISYT